MQVVLAFHLIFMVAWFAGLFYLPRLFVYHADAKDQISTDRFKIMERRLLYGIMNPAALLTGIFGYWLMTYRWTWYSAQHWLHVKLILVLCLACYHGICIKFCHDFEKNQNYRTAGFYRFFNEVPTVLLIAIILLAVLKPAF